MMKRPLLFLFVLIIATAAFAQPQPGGRRPGHSPREAGLVEILDLTAAQKGQLAELRETERERLEPLLDQQRANHEKVEAALAAGDAGAAGAAMLANYQLRDEIKAAHDAFAAAFAAILTPEQQAKFATLRELRELRESRPRRRP
jgi:Spy/CpxP family protein refolding chaperone